MKDNGQSVWSKMDHEQSNVAHDSSMLAVRFFACAANRVDNVVLSLGCISQTHAMNVHNALSTCLLCHARERSLLFLLLIPFNMPFASVLAMVHVVVCHCISSKLCLLSLFKCQSGYASFLNRRQFSRRVGFCHATT